MVFYGVEETLNEIKNIHEKHPIECDFNEFSEWNDFLLLTGKIQKDDNLMIILSRKEHVSYHGNMTKIPSYLNNYFKKNSFIIIYPMQIGVNDRSTLNLKDTSLLEPIERLDEIGKTLVNILKKNKK